MVTWTFDLVAILVGFIAGLIIGAFVALLVEMRDGGAWSKGFHEGCNLRHNIDDINKAVDYARNNKDKSNA